MKRGIAAFCCLLMVVCSMNITNHAVADNIPALEDDWYVLEDFDGNKSAKDYTVWSSENVSLIDNGADGNAFAHTMTTTWASFGIKLYQAKNYPSNCGWYKFNLKGPGALDINKKSGNFQISIQFNNAEGDTRRMALASEVPYNDLAGYIYVRNNGEKKWTKKSGINIILPNDFDGEIMFPLYLLCYFGTKKEMITTPISLKGWFSERNVYSFLDNGEKFAIDNICITNKDMCPENTGITGDSNRDGVLDIRDLIRVKKYFAQKAFSISVADTDMNKDGAVTLEDMVILCKILLGDERYKPVNVKLKVLESPTMTKEVNPPFSWYVWTETAPYTFKINDIKHALVSNARSVIYKLNDGKSVFDQGAYIKNSEKFASWPRSVDITNNTYISPDKIPAGGFWRLVYYNIFGAYQYGDNIYSVLHGENKNLYQGGYYYRNTIKPDNIQYTEDEYSNNTNGENWDNYFAFISMSRSKVSSVQETGSFIDEDFGPIVWPVRAYLDSNNEKQTGGVRHPSYIIKDGYIYVFYVDSPSKYQERVYCARARLDEEGKPTEFYKLYNGEFTEKALPDNFDINDRGIFYKAGGRGDNVVSSKNAIRFYPAKLKGTDYYIGLLEETVNGETHQLKLYVSKDLKTWTNEIIVPDSVRNNWNEGLMHYPMINDSVFCAGTEVGPDDFTIVGTTSVNGINGGWPTPQYMRLGIEIKEE